MKTILSAAAITVALLGAASAQEAYVNGGAIVNEGFDEVGIQARIGYDFSQYFGAEAEAIYYFGAVEDFTGEDYDIGQFAGFVKGQYPATDRVKIHARIGYGLVKVFDVPDGFSDSEDGFGYGVGAELAVAPASGLRFDYTRYEVENVDEGFFSLSYVYRFGGNQ